MNPLFDEKSRIVGDRAMAFAGLSEETPRRRPPSGAMAIVLSGFYEGLEVAIDRDRIVIGRGRKADLALAEATISRAHAALGFDGERFFVEDLGSTNGTLVNGAKVSRQILKSDDEIQMGKLRIGVSLPD
jgi:pSer/pThr/pTyr-binding forkhead associated (FHA) protein